MGFLLDGSVLLDDSVLLDGSVLLDDSFANSLMTTLLGGVVYPHLTYSCLRARVRHTKCEPRTDSADRPVERLSAGPVQEPEAVGHFSIRLAEHRDAQHELGVNAAAVRLQLLAKRGQLVLERHPGRQPEIRIAVRPRLGRGQRVFDQRVPAIDFDPRAPTPGHQVPVDAAHERSDHAVHA